jgi:16S rRNA C1402 N4-methylase RsmH
MLKIKVRKKEGKNMEKTELEELKKALEIVEKYDEQLKTKILNKKRKDRLIKRINDSIKQKEETSVAERLERLEKAISTITNKEIKDEMTERMKKEKKNG